MLFRSVISDLKNAEHYFKLLPGDLQWRKNYRVSLPMVELLLSRVYLYMEDWSNASEYAQKVIDNGNFQLLDLNIIEAFDENSGNRVYRNYHSYESPEAIWLYGSLEDVTYMVRRTGAEGRVFFKASDALMVSFDETPDDLRKDRYIVRESVASEENGEIVYNPQAFGKIAINHSGYGPGGTSNFARSFRLSEAYLNLSESYAMLYKESGDGTAMTKALNAVNKLRQSRFPRETEDVIEIRRASCRERV